MSKTATFNRYYVRAARLVPGDAVMIPGVIETFIVEAVSKSHGVVSVRFRSAANEALGYADRFMSNTVLHRAA